MKGPDHSVVFSYKDNHKVYCGIEFRNYLEQYLANRVSDRYYDKKGSEELLVSFEDIAQTEFDKETLMRIFDARTDEVGWRMGECLAECFLEDYCSAKIPFNGSRDQKNPKSSSAGADLIGFFCKQDEIIFLFGEVKTSSETSSPPNVTYGRTGLINQIESINEGIETKDNLVKWLAFKVKSLPEDDNIRSCFKEAMKAYISNCEKIKLVAVLVRDTPVNEMDLKNRYTSFCKKLKPSTQLRFLALYLNQPISNCLKLIQKNGDKEI